MTNSADGNGRSADTAAWRSRYKALEKIAKQIIPDKEEGPSSRAEESPSMLPKTPDQDILLDDRARAVPFQREYESLQRATCQHLRELLLAFTQNGSAFLERSGDHIEGSGQPAKAYSRRYLWRELLNEASADLQIIEAAYEQRLQEEGKNLIQTQSVFVADVLAEHALGQAVDNHFLQPTPILTFLSQNIAVRPVPYAAVILISVAYASMLEPVRNEGGENATRRVSRDLLAIPHEVGHHLFWHARMPGSEMSLYDQLQERLHEAKVWAWDWRRAWLEELFADVFGILVTGPLMALSFQDLLTDDTPDEFVEDNGHHPIPALRPLIQTCIMRRISDAQGQRVYVNAPELLDKRWEAWVEKTYQEKFANANPVEMEYTVRGLGQKLSGASILAALDEVIDILLQTLGAQRPSEPSEAYTPATWRPWTTDLGADKQDLEALYEGLQISNFPLEKRWLSYPEVTARSDCQGIPWPDLILAGWSLEGPEDRGAG